MLRPVFLSWSKSNACTSNVLKSEERETEKFPSFSQQTCLHPWKPWLLIAGSMVYQMRSHFSFQGLRHRLTWADQVPFERSQGAVKVKIQKLRPPQSLESMLPHSVQLKLEETMQRILLQIFWGIISEFVDSTTGYLRGLCSWRRSAKSWYPWNKAGCLTTKAWIWIKSNTSKH